MAISLTLRVGLGRPLTPLEHDANLSALKAAIEENTAQIAETMGVNFGSATPGTADRNKPWFKTSSDGTPIGWFVYAGGAWVQMPSPVPESGTTENRPSSPVNRQLYFDTTIDTMLIYERSAWRTLSGSPGDIKYSDKSTLAQALQFNPGWSHYTPGISRVIGGAGDPGGGSLSVRGKGDVVGAEKHTLVIDEMPTHKHGTKGNYGSGGEGGGDNPLYYDSAQGPVSVKDWPDTADAGGSKPHNNMQPTIFLWCLRKD